MTRYILDGLGQRFKRVFRDRQLVSFSTKFDALARDYMLKIGVLDELVARYKALEDLFVMRGTKLGHAQVERDKLTAERDAAVTELDRLQRENNMLAQTIVDQATHRVDCETAALKYGAALRTVDSTIAAVTTPNGTTQKIGRIVKEALA